MMIRLFILLVTFILFIHCSKNIDIAGNSSTVGNSTKVSGILKVKSGIPAKNIPVYLLRDIPSMSLKRSVPYYDSTFTNETGYFEFLIEFQDSGFYKIQANYGDSLSLVVQFSIAENPLDFGVLVMESKVDSLIDLDPNSVDSIIIPPPDTVLIDSNNNGDTNVIKIDTVGKLSGKIILPGDIQGVVGVELVGENKIINISSPDSMFEVLDIKPGNYSLRYWGVKPIRDTVIQRITVSAGLTTSIDLNFKISVIIIDGVNIHDWERVSPFVSGILESTNLFDVYRSQTPTDTLTSQWNQWDPSFDDHDVIILNVGGDKVFWPNNVKINFENFIKNGGGLVKLHGGNISFPNWEEYQNIVGLRMRNDTVWPGLFIDSTLNKVVDSSYSVSQHSLTGEYQIKLTNNINPITTGVPSTWKHVRDNYDLGLRGPSQNIQVLSFIDDTTSNTRQPVEWTVSYGTGRIFVTQLGHIGTNSAILPLQCVGLQTILIRSVEWTATGNISHSIPTDFPTAHNTSIR